jgi:hypothetical protein
VDLFTAAAVENSLAIHPSLGLHFTTQLAALLLFTFPLTAGFFLLSWKPKLLAKLLGKF